VRIVVGGLCVQWSLQANRCVGGNVYGPGRNRDGAEIRSLDAPSGNVDCGGIQSHEGSEDKGGQFHKRGIGSVWVNRGFHNRIGCGFVDSGVADHGMKPVFSIGHIVFSVVDSGCHSS
jgi:hypothetical protein